MIDWKRNNKVALRNFSEAVDLHDVVKLLYVRMLRRKYPDSKKVPIYTEYNDLDPHDSYPDVYFILDGEYYAVEIQDKIDKKWTEKIEKQHEDINLVIIPLKNMPKTISAIKKELEKYLL